jgi:hypothetical protein
MDKDDLIFGGDFFDLESEEDASTQKLELREENFAKLQSYLLISEDSAAYQTSLMLRPSTRRWMR